ncbi:MAG: hypothetical protein JSV88_09970 [Candidatus Aminicenantes bacterium]|nr:MAG: hypothetical protein JSV88_09970 [Candidatus Aminicenantes bacterium]
MAKNNFTKYTYCLLVVIIIFLVPGILHADLPQPLNFVDQLAGLLPLFLLFWPITVVVVTTIIKVWLLKGKLAVPWKFKPIEKLCLGTLAETIGEFIFLTLIIAFFAPALNDVFSHIKFTTPASQGFKVILHLAIVMPWYCIMGTILILVLIKFLTSMDSQELRRQYLKTSVFLSLILPVLIILILTVRILLFK